MYRYRSDSIGVQKANENTDLRFSSYIPPSCNQIQGREQFEITVHRVRPHNILEMTSCPKIIEDFQLVREIQSLACAFLPANYPGFLQSFLDPSLPVDPLTGGGRCPDGRRRK